MTAMHRCSSAPLPEDSVEEKWGPVEDEDWSMEGGEGRWQVAFNL